MFVDTDAKIEEFQVAFGLKDSKAERYAVVEQVVRGLKKQSPTITDAQTEAIIRLLTPASGKIDYMDFTRIVGTGASRPRSRSSSYSDARTLHSLH